MDPQIIFGWVDQIPDLLVVYFHHAYMYTEHDILACIFDIGEDGADHSRNDTLQLDILDVGALHCMRLAWRCLTVSEDRSIEAIEDTLNDGLGRCVIDFFLIWIHVKHSIECKVSVLFVHQILNGTNRLFNFFN